MSDKNNLKQKTTSNGVKEKIKKILNKSDGFWEKVFIAIIIFGLIYAVIIEPMLERKHCREMAREEARENCRYGDVDCIVDNYEYFYNLCLEHK